MKFPQNRKHLFHQDYLLITGALFLFLTAGLIHTRFRKPALEITKQDSALNVDKEFLAFLSAGNKRLLTDLLWIQTLLESDHEHYKNRDLGGWMYLRFLTISYLDPRFYENYLYGGQYLSIIKDDLPGAVDILKRGTDIFPQDYWLKFHLGFAYYYELGDFENGHFWLSQIAYHPKAPPFLPTIVNKMKFETESDFDSALAVVQEMLSNTKDTDLRNKLSKEIYAIKAERDLQCLNYGGEDCDRLDAHGEPYFFLKGKFRSRTPFVPYRLKRKGDQKAPISVDTV